MNRRPSLVRLWIFCCFAGFSLPSASARVLHVPADVPTIEEAISLAIPHDTVLVSPGIYYPTRELVFTRPCVTLMSEEPRTVWLGFPDQMGYLASLHIKSDSCVVEGLKVFSNAASVIGVFLQCGDPEYSIEGTRIENNLLLGLGFTSGIQDYGTAGHDKSHGTIVRDNDIQETMDAIAIDGYQMQVESNRVINNAGVGIMVGEDGIVRNNTIRNTMAITDYGTPYLSGGITAFFAPGPLLIEGNRIEDNFCDGWSTQEGVGRGGGLLILNSTSVRIENNWVARNQALRGAGIYTENSDVEMRHNLFWANRDSTNFPEENPSRGQGGGLYIKTSTGIIEGNTFVGNTALIEGSAAFFDTTSDLVVMNNIFARNRGDRTGLFCQGAPPQEYGCNDAWLNGQAEYGGWDDQTGINNNISVDPMFCYPDTANFTLDENSLCLLVNNPECGLIGTFGLGCGVMNVANRDQLEPASFRVYPTPSMRGVCVTYNSPVDYPATQLRIVDATGRTVRVLTQPQAAAGSHRIYWDGRSTDNRSVPAGIYYLVYCLESRQSTQKIVLIR
ncbi:MAG: right-handed parallel beta-helix repeat-containing protein [Patescibacteria group bacterium]|nr:right-handed parallel beta-helix repeat-containing protein [Patescibacteria group bacterium]